MPRDSNIGILRGIGILLVVAGHNWAILHNKDIYFRVIYVFHMPLFFFISGIFIKNEEHFSHFVKNKFSSILKPYISVSLLSTFAYCLSKNNYNWDLFLGILYGNGNTIIWTWLWFLPCLFASSLLTLVALKISKAKKEYVFSIALILLFVAYQINQIDNNLQLPIFQLNADRLAKANGLPFNLDLIPISASLMLLGFLTPKAAFHRASPVFIPIVLALLLIWIHFEFKPLLDMNERIISSPLAIYAAASISIFLSIELSKLIAKSTLLSIAFSKIGNASLFIYLFHFPAQALITFKLLKIFPDIPMLGYVTGFLCGIIAPYLIFTLRNKLRFISWLLLPNKTNYT